MIEVTDFCLVCQRATVSIAVQHVGVTVFKCKECGSAIGYDFDDDDGHPSESNQFEVKR